MLHKARVLDNITSLSNLTDNVIAKITSNIYSIASRKMLDMLGEEEYNAYIALQNDAEVVAEITDPNWSYEALSNSARKLKDLELAEAYCGLQYISIALRKIDIDTFMTQLESWGEGSIRPIDIQKIIEYSDKYLIEARKLAQPYFGDTGSVRFIAI